MGLFAGAAIGMVGPLGCLPTPPAIPAAEIPQATLEVPQAPELQVPEFQPPEIQKPEGPDLPAQPPPSEGNCCIRTGSLLKKLCGGAASCCTEEYESTSDCEEVKGFWFFTPEGCKGAC